MNNITTPSAKMIVPILRTPSFVEKITIRINPIMNVMRPIARVFDRTGGWRIPIGAHLGLSLGIFRKRGLERDWIGGFADRKNGVLKVVL